MYARTRLSVSTPLGALELRKDLVPEKKMLSIISYVHNDEAVTVLQL